jgi:putative ABC transport system permease protein
MVNLAYKDLFHKKGKFTLIILGLSISIFLVQYSAGMFNGVLTTSTDVLDKFKFDVWIREEDSDNFLDGGFVDDSVYNLVKEMKGVDKAERSILIGVEAEDEESTTFCYMFGCDINNPDHEIGPWDVTKGDEGLLIQNNTIMVDVSVKDYFDLSVNDYLKIENVWMKVVGFCENSRFMFNGYIFASIETARSLAPWAGNWITTIGITLEDDYAIEEFQEDVADDISHHLEVIPTEELKENTHDMIINEGGLGGSIYILVGMGFFVAIIILSVTMYQSIQEKIPVFGTLKAIGAGKGFINKMLYSQVFVYISVSFVLGTLLAILLGFMGGAIPILIDIIASIYLYIAFLLMGFACSTVTIVKVHKIDPAIVFK